MNLEKNMEATASKSDLPIQVFHYTSIDTLMKIVDSRSLWCTAISYLNDTGERRFLVEAVQSRLRTLKESRDTAISPDLAYSTPEELSDLPWFAKEVFVACFAEHGDSLMHWRAYCPQQAGIAISFRSQCLENARIMEKPLPGMVVPPVYFRRVEYLEIADSEVVDKQINEARLGAWFQVSKSNSWSFNDYFSGLIEVAACMSKRKNFEVEDELRLALLSVQHRENNIHFRTVRSTLIPYVPMAIPSWNDGSSPDYDFNEQRAWNAIESVVIGPTANMSLTQRSLEAYFALRGMKVKVLPSEIPYRDW